MCVQTVEPATDPENPTRVWEAVGNDGHEGRDNEWCHRWCDGGRGGWGGKVNCQHK